MTNVVGLVVTTAEVVRLHLEKVKRLLTDTDWNLSQIAEKMGFNYVEYLPRFSHRKSGSMPTEIASPLSQSNSCSIKSGHSVNTSRRGILLPTTLMVRKSVKRLESPPN